MARYHRAAGNGAGDYIMTEYALIPQLEGLIDSIQSDSIISKTFLNVGKHKAIMFGFDVGQELSEHTSSQAAIIQLVKGDATITLGDDKHELSAGAWMYMQPNLKHSIVAKTPLLMLLLMLGTD